MRLLVLAPRFPYPLDKGDRITVFNLLKYFSERHRVALVSFLEPGQRPEDRRHVESWVEAVYTVSLRGWEAYGNCLRGVLSGRPLQTWYYASGRMSRLVASAIAEFQPDLLYAHSIRMGEYFAHHDSRPKVLAMQIAMTLNYGRLARFSRHPFWKLLYAIEHRKVRRYEPKIAARYDRCLLISRVDVAAVSGSATSANVFINPHGVDFEFFQPDAMIRKEPGRMLFTGNMGYAPNADAVVYFSTEILPRVRREVPGVGLWVVGADPAPAVRRLARDPAIDVTGRVPDLRPYLNRAEVAIDPLRIGAGLQNKVLEAMAMGLPMVITSTANEGIGAVPDKHVLVADDAEAFAQAVVRLLRDEALRVRLGANARRFIVENWSWEKHFQDLERELESLVRP